MAAAVPRPLRAAVRRPAFASGSRACGLRGGPGAEVNLCGRAGGRDGCARRAPAGTPAGTPAGPAAAGVGELKPSGRRRHPHPAVGEEGAWAGREGPVLGDGAAVTVASPGQAFTYLRKFHDCCIKNFPLLLPKDTFFKKSAR